MTVRTQSDLNLSELDAAMRDANASGQIGGVDVNQMAMGLGNWIWMPSNTLPHAQTGTAAANVFVAAMRITPQVSGIFQLDCDVAFSVDTAATQTTLGLYAGPVTSGSGGIASTGTATATAQFGKVALGTVAGYTGGVAQGFVLGSDAAGAAASGLSLNGQTSLAGLLQYCSEQSASVANQLTAQASGPEGFSFHSIVGNAAGTVKTPFALGVPVYFGLGLAIAAAHVVTFGALAMGVRELPIG